MRRDLVALGFACVQPPLAGQRDHADQRLRVERGELGVVLPRLELSREDVLDLRRDVADQAGERPGGRRDWRVADEDAEAVGLFLDVNKEGESGLLEQLTGVAARQRA